jgi:hypothetical protein
MTEPFNAVIEFFSENTGYVLTPGNLSFTYMVPSRSITEPSPQFQ